MNIEPLKELALFDKFPKRALNALAGVMQLQDWKSGEVILQQGSASDGVYLILDGRVQVELKTSTGATVVVNQLMKGDLFGALSTLDGGSRGATCVAKSPVSGAFLNRSDFLELMEGVSPLALGFQVVIVRSIFSDIRRTNELYAEFSALENLADPSSVD